MRAKAIAFWNQVRKMWTKRNRRIAAIVIGAGIMLASYFGALPIFYGVVVALVGLWAGLRLIITVVRDSIEITDCTKDPKILRHIVQGENVIRATREHPIVILLALVSPKNLIAIGAGLVAGFVLGHGSIALVVLGALLGYAIRITWRIIVYRTDLLVLTDHEVFIASGPLSRSTVSIPLRNIGGTDVKTPLIARILTGIRFTEADFGTIVTQGVGAAIFDRFKYTPAADDFRRAIKQAQISS